MIFATGSTNLRPWLKNYQTQRNFLQLLLDHAKRTGHFDKAKETEVVVHGRDKFSVESFLFIVDQLLSALENKIEAYIEIRNVLKWQRNLTI